MKIFKCFLILISSLTMVAFVITAISIAEEPIHPGYPYVFDMTGKIDRISDTDIVIGDVLCKIDFQTTFHSFDTAFAKTGSFNQNDNIGILFSDPEKRFLLSVWLIKRAE